MKRLEISITSAFAVLTAISPAYGLPFNNLELGNRHVPHELDIDDGGFSRFSQYETNTAQSTPGILSVPCFDGGGSGGWMYEDLPAEYFPLGLISANEWPLRSASEHPMYNPDAPWNKYATCVVVPANQS